MKQKGHGMTGCTKRCRACHKPDNLKMMSWLEDIETDFPNIQALAPYSNDDTVGMLIRAHYTRIPLKLSRIAYRFRD